MTSLLTAAKQCDGDESPKHNAKKGNPPTLYVLQAPEMYNEISVPFQPAVFASFK
jgi:hypothetical protein